jgi:predicted Zn-dependent protease
LFEPHYELVRKKQYKKAISVLMTPEHTIRPEFQAFPNHVWYCVGTVYFSLGDYVEAISFLKRALQDWPGDVQAWLALGNSYSEQKCFQEASHCFHAIMVLDPSHTDAVFNYASALIDMGQFEKAKRVLEGIGEPTETVLRQIAFCDARMGL